VLDGWFNQPPWPALSRCERWPSSSPLPVWERPTTPASAGEGRSRKSDFLHAASPRVHILNHMVQYVHTHLDASFAALSDATRRGVLEQLGRSDASITDLAEKFRMTLTGMKKHLGVLENITTACGFPSQL
jgi:hypothetical protein